MSSAGTTHGTGYFYDERVPVLLFGAGIKPGKYWGDREPADIAPTLAALCGITMARPDGRVLSEALAAPSATPPAPTSAQRTLKEPPSPNPLPQGRGLTFVPEGSGLGGKGRSSRSSAAAAA